MTRSELIRKLAKYSGVPESETKVFFEIFLKKFPVMLKPGQSLQINKLGYFYFLQGKIRKPEKYENAEPEFEVIDLVYFSNSEIDNNLVFDGLFFNVPVADEEEFNAVDAAFSLSFGKPLIDLRGNVESEFYIPHTGLELRRLIESKVDKTIDNSELIDVIDLIAEPLIIEAAMFRQASDITTTEVKEGDELPEPEGLTDDEVHPQVRIEKNSENLSWEIDRDLSRQIEEDAILDLADENEDKDRNNQQQELSWDFASFDDIVAKSKKKSDEPEAEDKDEQLSRVEIEYDEEKETETSEETDKKPTEEPKEKFERVKTITKFSDLTPVENLTDSELSDDSALNEEELKEPKSKGEEDDKDFIELKPAEEKLIAVTEKDFDDQNLTDDEEEIKLTFSRQEAKERFEQLRREKSSSIVPYFLLILSVAIISYAVYYYLTNVKGISEQITEISDTQFNIDRMIAIEREIEFPVTYPYPAKTGSRNKIDELFNIRTNETLQVPDQESTEPVTPKVTHQPPDVIAEINNKAPEGSVTRIGVNVFQYGQYYIVQVAAFRSLSVAQTEADRFRNKGYNSFVERAEINGTLWHRVKVGNFTNLEAAEKFAVQFK